VFLLGEMCNLIESCLMMNKTCLEVKTIFNQVDIVEFRDHDYK